LLKPAFKFSNRKLFVFFLVVLIAQIVDETIGNLSDILRDFAISFWGVALFIAIAAIYGFGQYFILGMVRAKNKEQEIKRMHFNVIEKIVTVVQYVLTAIMVLVVLQIFFSSQYYVPVLNIAVTISGGLAVYIMSMLSYWFLSWFRINRALILLLYGLAVAMTAISVGAQVVLFNTDLLEKPLVVTPQSDVIFSVSDTAKLSTWANTVQTESGVASFILIWGGTVLLLRHNIHRIGNVKFWILLSSPLVFFSSFYLSFYQSIAGTVPTEDPMSSTVMPVLLIIFSGVAAATLIGISFFSVAKPLSNTTHIKDYMIITSYGLILFFTTTLTSIAGAGYPPFGLVNVLLVGPFSFLILTGLYRSAVSVAEDVKLRRSIKNTAKKELKLLEDIGTAEMYQEIEKRVTAVTKANADQLAQQSGIEPSLTDEEIRNSLAQVKEIQDLLTNVKKGD
jgi:hypothetical protein